MRHMSKEKAKELKKLQQKKYREERRTVLVEGVRSIKQLITDRIPILEIYCYEPALNIYKDVLVSIPEQNIYIITDYHIEKISATKSPQDIFALVEMKVPVYKRQERFVYIENVSDPGNVGAIFRTAKAAGMDGIILSPGCCDIFNPKTIRSSVGTVFSLPSKIDDQSILKELPHEIIVTDSKEGTSLFSSIYKGEPYVLVIGSEATGVSKDLYKIANRRIRIPMAGKLESLNVAVAAGLCMYQLNKDIIK